MTNLLKRVEHALGPVLIGIIIDSLDLITVGPFGIYSGFFIGFFISTFLLRNSTL